MKLNIKNVPEKLYFSFQDIADRWECDISLISELVEDRKLRAAAKVSDLPIHGIITGLDELLLDDPSFAVLLSKAPDIIFQVPLDEIGDRECNYFGLRDDRCSIPINNLIRKDKIIKTAKLLDRYKFLYPVPDKAFALTTSLDEIVLCYINEKYNENYELCTDINIFAFHNKCFKYIAKEERDRFEKEYGITKDTDNVQKQVGKKTENIHLELIQIFANEILRNGLSEEPFTDAEKLIQKFASKGVDLPCKRQALANYLRST